MKITKRKDGRYSISVQFKGKRKWFIGTNKEEVKDRAIEYIDLHNKGIEISGDDISVSRLADEWFDVKQRKNAIKTQKETKRLLNNYIISELGDYRIKSLKPLHVQKMLNKMIDRGLTSSIKKVYQIIHSILEFAVDNDYCIKNVAKGCTFPRHIPEERQILSKNDIKILEASNSKYRDFFVFILYTGLRRGEVSALRWVDVDFSKKQIHVKHSMSFVTNQGTIKTTKNNKERTIPILDKTLEILKRRKNETNSIYVFSQKNGHNLTESAINRMHECILKDTRLHFKIHDLRHTFCTILYYAGVSSIHASEIMGHSLAVMQSIYTHLDSDKAQKEVEKLNKFVLM